MSDQINLFDLFEDTFGEDTVITEVAPAPKKEEKKEDKKTKAKKPIAENITLPVTVYASQWKEEISEIDGKTEVTLEELKTYLVNEGYVEIKASFTEVVKEDAGVVVGISGLTSYPNTPILGEQFTVATGQYTMALSVEADFDGIEKNLGSVARKWEEQYPQYKDAKLIVDLGSGIGYPISGEKIEKIPAGTVKYYYNGAVQEKELAEETDAAKLVEIVTGVAGGTVYKTSEDVLFVTLDRKASKKGKSSSSGSSATKAPAKPKEVLKIKLPFTATFTHCADKQITTEQFPGKEEVTEDEFVAWLPNNVSEEYTTDKTELLYFKNDNVVEVRLRSAKRG